ncbi:MAG: hypothetical protein PHI97_10190, partial [Desulfobulbus sp.]|nr:hypothetical protein [Desulfobulbus sp.]
FTAEPAVGTGSSFLGPIGPVIPGGEGVIFTMTIGTTNMIATLRRIVAGTTKNGLITITGGMINAVQPIHAGMTTTALRLIRVVTIRAVLRSIPGGMTANGLMSISGGMIPVGHKLILGKGIIDARIWTSSVRIREAGQWTSVGGIETTWISTEINAISVT